ncbi:hypothetical protein C7T94_16565 [Pedobacter yulinensis]|uniref:YcxB-like protein domain-containing protein n=1 Tax=Pedobacter yulinensis TaxID=2126353 RepID=A0A2T3HIW4_9SPHI|nr:hypothetical protein [Pedobacter yulinensis]PST82388.1 hypothetical protein C7T94_16565 [Pedobacter yulinensis]
MLIQNELKNEEITVLSVPVHYPKETLLRSKLRASWKKGILLVVVASLLAAGLLSLVNLSNFLLQFFVTLLIFAALGYVLIAWSVKRESERLRSLQLELELTEAGVSFVNHTLNKRNSFSWDAVRATYTPGKDWEFFFPRIGQYAFISEKMLTERYHSKILSWSKH